MLWATLLMSVTTGDALAQQRRDGLPPIDIRNARSQGRSSIADGRFADAAEYFSDVVALRPTDADSWYFLGRSHQLAGNLPKAILTLERAAEFQEHRPSACYNLARIYSQLGDANTAMQQLRAAVDAGFRSIDIRTDHEIALLRNEDDFPSLAQRALLAGQWQQYRELDFWQGEWFIQDAGSLESGKPRADEETASGQSSVQFLTTNFILEEAWRTEDGEVGRRYFYYNPNDAQWIETTIASNYQSRAAGSFVDGVLTLKGHRFEAGNKLEITATIEVAGDDVRYRVAAFPSNGEEAEVLTDRIYRKQSAAEDPGGR